MSLKNSSTNNNPITIRLAVFDVGQGDTIVISSPETSEAIVVDCVDADQVITYLEEQNIQYLRGVIITHLHADHYCAVHSLIEQCLNNGNLPNCEKLLYNPIGEASGTLRKKLVNDADGHSISIDLRRVKAFHQRLPDLLRQYKIPCGPIAIEGYEPRPLSEYISEGEIAKYIHILHPHFIQLSNPAEIKNWGLNNLSVTLMVKTQKSAALLLADLEPDGWDSVKNSDANVVADVVKFPHHGAWKRDDASDFIRSINPSVAVISVGTDNKYDHPNDTLFSALTAFPKIRLLCTQATNKCQLSVLTHRKIVTQKILEGGKNNYLVNRNGCACAGTTIIELGEKVQVLHPSTKLHVDEIITPHFTNHQCNLSSITSPIVSSDLTDVAQE